jgi:hypothetical protein
MTAPQGSATIECNGWLTEGTPMPDNTVAYVAIYNDLDSAMTDLDVLRELPDDDVIGNHDAAVIDQENGKPHIVKRVDRPHIHIVSELVGRGALPSGRHRDAVKALKPGEAALLVVGEPTFEKAFAKAVALSNKESFDADADSRIEADEEVSQSNRSIRGRDPTLQPRDDHDLSE